MHALVVRQPANRRAVLLAKPRPELAGAQGAIVDALKAGWPGYAVMRPLMLGFGRCCESPPRKQEDTHHRCPAPVDGPRAGDAVVGPT
jgi:hypothetical protein